MSGVHDRQRESGAQKTLRAFVAVPIPDTVAVFLKDIQRRLQLAGLEVRWAEVKNIHLTLKFLGEIDPSRIHTVSAWMDKAAGLKPPFSLKASEVGVFPNRRRARALWVGLDSDHHCLETIQAELESGLESAGFSRETRRFHPHLTIGRTRRRIAAQAIDAAMEPLKAVASDWFRVDRLRLYKSDLKPAGAEYTLLYTSHLGGEKIQDDTCRRC